MHKLPALILVCVFFWVPVSICPGADSIDPADPIFDPEDRDSVAEYLHLLIPPSEAEVLKVIKDLGADEYATRHRAEIALSRYVNQMRDFIKQQHGKTTDPQVRAGIALALAKSAAKKPPSVIGRPNLVTEAIFNHGHRGLAAELISIIALAKNGIEQEYLIAAARISADSGDRAELLKALSASSAPTREAAIRVLRVLEGDHRDKLKTLLNDPDPSVKLAAAEVFAAKSDSACIEILAELLTGEDFYIRWRAAELLRQTTSGAIKADPLIASVVDVEKWKKSKSLSPSATPEPLVLLSDGREIKGWRRAQYSLFDELVAEQHDGFVRLDGSGSCIWAHPLRFQNYRLHLEWRYSVMVDSYCDSGLSLAKFSGNIGKRFNDWGRGRTVAIEVEIKPRGSGIMPKLAPLDAKRSEWNRLDVEERDGRLRVFVNGILQHESKKHAVELTTFGLRHEGYPIDFRNMTLEPLPGARVGREPEEEAKDAK